MRRSLAVVGAVLTACGGGTEAPPPTTLAAVTTTAAPTTTMPPTTVAAAPSPSPAAVRVAEVAKPTTSVTRPPAKIVPPMPLRAFVAALGSAEGPRPKGNVQGFEAANVDVRRAPEVEGRIEWEPVPEKARAGDAYRIKVFLKNLGSRPMTVSRLAVTTTSSSTHEKQTPVPATAEVGFRERVLLHELRGTIPATAQTLTVDVEATSKSGDTYTGQLSCK